MKHNNNSIPFITRLLISLSAFLPLVIMILIKNFGLVTYVTLIPIAIISILSIIFLSLFLITLNKVSGKTYKIIDYYLINDKVALYSINIYLIPLLTLDFNNSISVILNLLLLILVETYILKNNSLYFNIILLILGYNIYKTRDEKIIISKYNFSQIKNNSYQVRQYGTSNIFYIK